MTTRQPLPLLWLLSDVRNDAQLGAALAGLPARSGFVFRHYHLDRTARLERYRMLAGIARQHGHLVIVARGDTHFAGADGTYGPADRHPAQPGLFLTTAHDGSEIEAAEAAGADGIFLSPVFPTRSHPDGRTLGAMGFHVLAQRTPLPVIALGGMTARRAAELGWPRWAAIDGLS